MLPRCVRPEIAWYAGLFSCSLQSFSRTHNRMQIAQIAPLTEAIPPKLYGGTERVISWLTDELVALGHDVVLFASGDSQTSAHLDACWPTALRLDGSVRDPNALHMAMLERVCQRAHDFDLLHFHLDYYPFSLFSRQSRAFVTTFHGRLDLPEHQIVFATFPTIPVISISDSQRRPVPNAGWIRTIHHGLPERLLLPQPVRPAYFAFLGRISSWRPCGPQNFLDAGPPNSDPQRCD
jgi:glycosyltransferase involved in cell wall biosynthesis